MSVRKRTWYLPQGIASKEAKRLGVSLRDEDGRKAVHVSLDAKGQTKRESWIVDYKDSDGHRRLETFDKKRDADAREAEVKEEMRTGTHVARGASITISEAGENWIQRGEIAGLERATCQTYREHLEKHIKPYLGNVKLSDLSAPDVAAFERELHKAGVSDAMRKKVLVSLSSILREAVRAGAVNRNVADGMGIKTNKRKRKRLEIGRDIPATDEVRLFLASLNDNWRPFFMTAVFTGMRASELRGLHWRNVDLDAGEIHVRERADRYNNIDVPKSESSYRTIPIGPMVANTIKEWKLRYPRPIVGRYADGQPMREEHKGEHLVFATRTGNVQSATNIRKRALMPAMVKAGIAVDTGETDKDGKPVMAAKYTGLHSLRHFYASWLINPRERGGQGLPPKVVQERMGHATLALTMDTYSHLFPRGDDADQIAEAERSLIGLAH